MLIERFLLPGSERATRGDAQPVGTPNLSDTIAVSLLLRRRAALDLSRHHEPLTREEFAARYGAAPDDVRRVEAFAQQFNLTVLSVELGRRVVVLTGTIAAL